MPKQKSKDYQMIRLLRIAIRNAIRNASKEGDKGRYQLHMAEKRLKQLLRE